MVFVGVDQHSTQITVHMIQEGVEGVERRNRRYVLDRGKYALNLPAVPL